MLLKCLMGFYVPDQGHVIKANHLKVGYVPQKFSSVHTMPISVLQFLNLRKTLSSVNWREFQPKQMSQTFISLLMFYREANVKILLAKV